MEERNNGLLGKEILIIFEDGFQHISQKTGTVTNNSPTEIELDNKHIIPKSRIIRMEKKGDKDDGS